MVTIKDLLNKFDIDIELPKIWLEDELDEEDEYEYHTESINYDRVMDEEVQDTHRTIEPYEIHVFSCPGNGRGPVQEKEEDEIIIDTNNMLLTYIRADGTVLQFDENGEIVMNWV